MDALAEERRHAERCRDGLHRMLDAARGNVIGGHRRGRRPDGGVDRRAARRQPGALNLPYVALTRAVTRLDVVHERPLPPELGIPN